MNHSKKVAALSAVVIIAAIFLLYLTYLSRSVPAQKAVPLSGTLGNSTSHFLTNNDIYAIYSIKRFPTYSSSSNLSKSQFMLLYVRHGNDSRITLSGPSTGISNLFFYNGSYYSCFASWSDAASYTIGHELNASLSELNPQCIAKQPAGTDSIKQIFYSNLGYIGMGDLPVDLDLFSGANVSSIYYLGNASMLSLYNFSSTNSSFNDIKCRQYSGDFNINSTFNSTFQGEIYSAYGYNATNIIGKMGMCLSGRYGIPLNYQVLLYPAGGNNASEIIKLMPVFGVIPNGIYYVNATEVYISNASNANVAAPGYLLSDIASGNFLNPSQGGGG